MKDSIRLHDDGTSANGTNQPNITVPLAPPTDAITLRDRTQSPLLGLPPDNRNAVYAYTLGHHRICIYTKIGAEEHDREGTCKPEPIDDLLNITMTCRQVHAESALMFFKVNEFGSHGYSSSAMRGYSASSTILLPNNSSLWTVCPDYGAWKVKQYPSEVTVRDANEARNKDLVHDEASAEVAVVFDYATGVGQGSGAYPFVGLYESDEEEEDSDGDESDAEEEDGDSDDDENDDVGEDEDLESDGYEDEEHGDISSDGDEDMLT
ncbi:hypothetical protein IQ06DRAFT_372616 [Phaeosphaeriaceae sp. SRC1lsM3a]|nr:hypothetical protein IQ06DRAFT_372616 [Stagonospora sp. SRC1lsM3a]